MKKIIIFFVVFCVVASVIMVKLTRGGVSIRSAPIIGASPQGTEYKNIAPAVLNRLFPDFQMANYVVIGSAANLKMGPQIINDLKIRYEEQFKKTVTLIFDDQKMTEESILNCVQPCWILTSETQAHELSVENKIPQILKKHENIKHFHMTLIPFSKVVEPTQECIAEKRLDLECLIQLSIHEVSKKFKDRTVSYFFMRKYQDRDYFLFIQDGQLQ